MEDSELVKLLAKATAEIMQQTGDSFDVAVKKAKTGLKEYIRLRVETAKDLVAQGYSESRALSESKRLVNLALVMR